MQNLTNWNLQGKRRVNKKNFEREELPHGLFLTAR